MRTVRICAIVAAAAAVLAAETSAAAPIDRAGQLLAGGRYAEAVAAFRSAIGGMSGASDHVLFAAHANLGTALYYDGRYAEAEAAYDEALRIRGLIPPESRPGAAAVRNNMATLFRRMGRFDRAERIHREVLAERERAEGPASPGVAVSLTNLAEAYRAQQRYGEAEAAARRGVAILASRPAEPLPLSYALQQLAAIRQARGDAAEAGRLLDRVLRIRESTLPPGHPAVAGALAAIGSLRIGQQRYPEAEAALRGAVESWRAAGHERAPEFVAAVNNLAQVFKLTGRFTEAESLYRDAIARSRQLLGPEHPEHALFLGNFADFLLAAGRTRAAAQVLETALAVLEPRFGAAHPTVARLETDLAGARASLLRDRRATVSLQELRSGR